MTELRWHPAAAREAQAARRWYRIEQDAPEVARRFQSMLLRALTEVSSAPERWPVLVDDFTRFRKWRKWMGSPMTNGERLELRAKEPVAQCLIRRLTVPRVYFDAEWPGYQQGGVDLLVIDRDGVGDAHLVEIKYTAKSALACVPQLLSASAPFRWIAYLRGTEDAETSLALQSKEQLYAAHSPGRVGVIQIVEMTSGDLGANVTVSAERFPDAVYDVATAFSGSHKANI